ncbi:Hypothetical predicted protein, partial [Pelobates cultripes]
MAETNTPELHSLPLHCSDQQDYAINILSRLDAAFEHFWAQLAERLAASHFLQAESDQRFWRQEPGETPCGKSTSQARVSLLTHSPRL